MSPSKYNCRVCFFPQKNPPWGLDGKAPTYGICPCCGVEFGYEDSTEEGIKEYRSQWITSGYKWFDESQKPKDWKWEKQPQ